MRNDDDPQAKLDTNLPHSARVWNYLLGGKDNFAADRAVGDKVRDQYPEIVEIARAGRLFLARAVRYLAREAGIRQFIDLGTGLPADNNTHEVAQEIAPTCKIVYVDNDPLVLAHAQALLTSDPQGRTDHLYADVRNPDTVLHEAARTLDLDQPIAVLMLGILGHIPDGDQPGKIVARFVDALPAGSYLAVNDSIATPRSVAAAQTARDRGADYHLRTPAQIEQFFTGLDLLEPGVVSTPQWRNPSGNTQQLDVYCGLARKP